MNREGRDPSESGVRSPSRATRHRVKARQSNAFMTRDQVFAAHRLYRAGVPIRAIVDRTWERFGFANRGSCEGALYEAFTSYGLKMKTRWADSRCRGCECPLDERTYGCATCKSRHHYRRRKGLAHAENRGCVGCGVTLGARTRGCVVCKSRLSKRRTRTPERSRA